MTQSALKEKKTEMFVRNIKTTLASSLFAAALSPAAMAQTPPPVILAIDISPNPGLAARGVMGQSATPQTVTQRVASMAEDPANRRTHVGGSRKYILYIIPMTRPEIITTPSGVAVFHGDLSPVHGLTPGSHFQPTRRSRSLPRWTFW